MGTWTENVVCTHWEYYAALKRKELLAQATTWISIKDIMPSEIIQSLCFYFYEVPGGVLLIETESRMVGAWGWG